MSTVVTSGTLTANGSEDTIGAVQNTAGTYIVVVDASNMSAGDATLLKAKRKVLSSDSAAVIVYEAAFQNAQADPVKISIPIPSPVNCAVGFTLTQTAGINRSYNYSIETL